MGHMIQCFIGDSDVIEAIISPLKQAAPSIADLPRGLQCLFLCDNISGAIHSYVKAGSNIEVKPFDFLDQAITEYLENIKTDKYFIYIETEYFGGVGTQASAVFKDGKILETYKEKPNEVDITKPYPDRLLELPVNRALRYVGVIREFNLDEFDTLGLGNYRHMPYNEI